VRRRARRGRAHVGCCSAHACGALVFCPWPALPRQLPEGRPAATGRLPWVGLLHRTARRNPPHARTCACAPPERGSCTHRWALVHHLRTSERPGLSPGRLCGRGCTHRWALVHHPWTLCTAGPQRWATLWQGLQRSAALTVCAALGDMQREAARLQLPPNSTFEVRPGARQGGGGPPLTGAEQAQSQWGAAGFTPGR
jgi:hypothetical protein